MSPAAREAPIVTVGFAHDEAPPRRSRLRVRRIFAALLLFAALLAVGSELLLVPLAERRVSSGLEDHASGVDVSIAARPAVKLLIGRADSVRVRIAALTADGGRAGDLIAKMRHVGRLDAEVGRMRSHGLTLTRVVLHEDHGRLTARASVTRAAIRAALPSAVQMEPMPAAHGGVRFVARARALDRTVRVSATVRVRNGRLVLAPDSLAGVLLQLTLFSDPRVVVDRIAVHGTDPLTFAAAAHYR